MPKRYFGKISFAPVFPYHKKTKSVLIIKAISQLILTFRLTRMKACWFFGGSSLTILIRNLLINFPKINCGRFRNPTGLLKRFEIREKFFFSKRKGLYTFYKSVKRVEIQTYTAP